MRVGWRGRLQSSCLTIGSMNSRDLRFEVLSGLPPYGPAAVSFPSNGKGSHSEGVVVRFYDSAGESWVGNFQGEGTQFSGVIEHPNRRDLIVISRGTGYVVDPEVRKGEGSFGCGYTASLANQDVVLFATDCDVTAIDSHGVRWCSRRISWDGIHDLRFTADQTVVHGNAAHYSSELMLFEIDVRTGEARGGSYDGPR